MAAVPLKMSPVGGGEDDLGYNNVKMVNLRSKVESGNIKKLPDRMAAAC